MGFQFCGKRKLTYFHGEKRKGRAYCKNPWWCPGPIWFRKLFLEGGLIHGDYIGILCRPIWFSKLFLEGVFAGGLSMGTILAFFVGLSSLGEVKNIWFWSLRARLLPRARHIFFIFLFQFFLSLIERKAIVCAEKIRYLIVIALFALYDKSWRLFPL